MNPRARRFLSWTFIATFFLLAPAIILSTAGYRYNFARARLERTGVIVVETKPAGASVSLNNTLQKAETPTQISKVTPGTYAIRVEKANYHPWVNTVNVGSRESLFLTQIPLFKKAAPTLLKGGASPTTASFSHDARYAAFVASASSGSEIAVVDTTFGTISLPYRSSADSTSFSLSWSPKESTLLISGVGKKPLFLLWSPDEPGRVRDLAEEAGVAFTEAFWAQDAHRLYGVADGRLYQIETELIAAIEIGPSVLAPIVAAESLYGINETGHTSLVKRRLRDTTFETIAKLPSAKFAPIAGNGGRITYASLTGDRLFTIDPSGSRPTAFEGRGRDGLWSDDNSRLLYWNDLEIRVYDARSGSDELLNRMSESISQASWQHPEWSVLYAMGNSLFGMESADRFGRMTVKLAEFQKLHRFAISPNGDTAFIFGTLGGKDGLWELPLR